MSTRMCRFLPLIFLPASYPSDFFSSIFYPLPFFQNHARTDPWARPFTSIPTPCA